MMESNEMVLPRLLSLKLSNLPEHVSLVSGAPQIICRSLKNMTIEACPNLTVNFGDPSMPVQEQNPSKPNSIEVTHPHFLENLNLHGLSQLKKISKDRLAGFMHLTSLRLNECENLEYVFSLGIAKGLSSLQELKVISCQKVEQIIRRETEEAATAVEFPQVNTLVLEKLPKFTGFFSQEGCSVKWLSLKKVKVVECPKIKNTMLGTVDRPLLTSVEVSRNPWQDDDNLERNIIHLFHLTDELSSLQDLTIEDSQNLKKYMEMELQVSSFSQLKILKARQCDEELNKFLSILLTRSLELEHLTIENCKPLEHVFDLKDLAVDEQGDKKFPNLKIMTFSGLPKLNCIWNNDPRGIVELGNLVKIEIINCGLRKSLLSTSLLKELVRLEELKVDSCMIEQVVEEDMEMQEISFPSFKNIQLLSLPDFIKFNSGNCNFKFPELLSLTIEKCPKMNAFTAGFLSNQKPTMGGTSDHDACPELQTLKLVGLEPFKEIWQESFSKPKEIEVDSLSNLKYIFPSSMLPRLEKLEKLIVRNCSSLSNIVSQQTGTKDMKLPELSELSLICLPEMEHVFENDSIMDFEKLQIVSVKRCGSLERLLLPSCCPKLKKIEISDCDILKEIFFDAQAQRTDICFPRLESIILKNLPKLSSFSLETFEFPSLQKVRIDGCPEIQTFSRNVSATADNVFMDVDCFEKLKELHLINVGGSRSRDACEVLFHIKEASQLLPELEELGLSDLPNPQLWREEPNIPVFRHLTSLKIIRCGSIEKLFSISLAKHLSVLKFLKLYGCENMVQVLSKEEKEDMDQVLQGRDGNKEKLFEKLESLILRDLPNLTNFCQENVDFGEFPELKMVRVENIPKMKKFVEGSLKTPKLKEVYVTHIAKCWRGDLNNTITYLYDWHAKLEANVWAPLRKSPGNSSRDRTDVAESSLQGMKRMSSSSKEEDTFLN